MGRLIDVENYCRNICRCNNKKCNKEKCPIWNAPTAYNVDKVVEELKERIMELNDNFVMAENKSAIVKTGANSRINELYGAIDVVRKGGGKE